MAALAGIPPNLQAKEGRESWAKQSQSEPRYCASEGAEDGEWPTNGAAPVGRESEMLVSVGVPARVQVSMRGRFGVLTSEVLCARVVVAGKLSRELFRVESGQTGDSSCNSRPRVSDAEVWPA